MLKLPSGFKMVRVTSNILESAIKGMRPYFHDENISIGVDLASEPGAVEEMENVCRKATLDGVSFVAIDEATGDVAGTIINRIQTKGQRFYEDFLETTKYDNSRAMLSSIIEIYSTPNIFNYYDVNCAIEFMFLSINPEYRNKGLGKALTTNVMKLAWDINEGKTDADIQIAARPEVVFSHATAPITQKILMQLKWENLKVTKFADLTFRDRSFASRIGKDDGVAVFFARRL